MKEKNPKPKIFVNEGSATPRHDEMLLLLAKERPEVSKLIRKLFNYSELGKQDTEKLKNLNEEEKYWVILEKMSDRINVCRKHICFFSAYDKKHYRITAQNYMQLSYLGAEIVEYWIAGKERGKTDFDTALKNGKIVEIVGNMEEIHTKLTPRRFFDIFKWEPEKPIMNGNYYVGSVDLFLEIKNHEWLDYFKDGKFLSNGLVRDTFLTNVIIDFKPKIQSFSEVIRQMKVYEQYFPKSKLVVITDSDKTKFASVFESQGILLINPSDLETI